MASDRTSITDGPLGLEIVVRPRRDWGLRLVLPVWLLGWTVGEVFALVTIVASIAGTSRPFAGPVGFIGLWLVLWTAGGAFAWAAFLYNVAGRERVRIDGTWITVSRELFRWSLSQQYALAEVRRLRFSPPVNSRNNWGNSMQQWGFGGGSVAFDIDGKATRFGSALTEDESESVIDEIQRRFPIPAK